MKREFVLLVAWVMGWANAGFGITPGPTATQELPKDAAVLRGYYRQEQVHIRRAFNELGRIYGAPISVEWPYVNEDRTEFEYPSILFHVIPDATLSQALDDVCSKSSQPLTWTRVHGVICVQGAPRKEGYENLFDVPVSVDLKDVSTWEAFLAVGKAINARPDGDRYVRMQPAFWQQHYNTPDAFRNEKTISLQVKDVPVRDVICRIIAASSLNITYTYDNSYSPKRYPQSRPYASVYFWIYDADGLPLHGLTMGPMESRAIWRSDIESIVPEDARLFAK